MTFAEIPFEKTGVCVCQIAFTYFFILALEVLCEKNCPRLSYENVENSTFT
jgi:hypothetical protein